MSDKYIRTIRRMALDGSLDAQTAHKLLEAHDAEWREEQHPRGKGGKFAPKGSGSVSGGGSSGSSGKPSGWTPEIESKVKASEERQKAKGLVQAPGGKWMEPKELEKLEKAAREYGYRDYQHMLNAAHGEEMPTEGGSSTAPLVKNGTQYPRRSEKGSGVAGMVRAARITAIGEKSKKSKVAEMDSGARFASKPGLMKEGGGFPQGSAFNQPKSGTATKTMPNGTGATKLSVGDLYDERKPDVRHTINQYLDDDGNLTPEREALHAQSVDNMFAGKKPKGPGEKKTFTMFGGGSAAGKGGLSDPARCKGFQSSFFTGGTPNKNDVATIDADEIKKDIPEYREMQKTDADNAAAVAHEESSAIAKRAMQAAFENGYDCTLDGTGDGSVNGVRKKIAEARAHGYEVNACYVTCPTDQAVKQAKDRAKRTNRNVKEGTVRSIHREVSRIFPQVASDFDHCALFDTRDHNSPPVLIAECERGGKIRIRNQKL